MKAEILIIDDNPDIRNILKDIIEDSGFKTRIAANYNQALTEIDKKLPDVAIIDVKLDKGDNDGIELLSHIKKINSDIPVIIISGHANIEMAVKSLQSGAFEFIEKPFDKDRLINFVNRAVENLKLRNENKNLQSRLFQSFELVGKSDNIEIIKDQINKLSNTESRVLIYGPTGSGKELIARKIHNQSNRSNNPFIIINAALLDVQKYELELFGEERSDGTISYGALEKSTGGTLLIDQVSEIPLETQSKILRVLTDQKFRRINGNHDVKVNVRIICSTIKDIREEIHLGNFREDLFHRLNVIQIKVDPLSKKIEDIPLLIEYFSKIISDSYNIKKLELNSYTNYLINYSWPGNIRELRNLIERIAILTPGSKNEKILNIIKESIKQRENDVFDVNDTLLVPLKEARVNFEKEYLTSQLKKFGGNINKTAKFVGMERSALYRKLKILGVKGLN
jgi:two-component system nitrogen regulation response regulator NtrX